MLFRRQPGVERSRRDRHNESRRQEMVFPNRSSNRGGRRRGGAAGELALVAPLLLFVLIVAIDFCRLFFHYTTITNAARNGALWLIDRDRRTGECDSERYRTISV